MATWAMTTPRKWLVVATVWLAVLSLCYLALESLFFCCTASLFPYSARVDMGFGIYPLLQTSKRSTVPERYSAIFGDSYAFGTGDWFLQVQQQRNPVFNVAHLLHERTGEDFISFGIPGSSNLCGWIEDPVSALRYINAGLRYHLPDPDTIVLFFYEGNDIQEGNMDFHARYLDNHYDPTRLEDPAYFARFTEQEMINKNRYLKAREAHPILEEFYFTRLVMNVASNAIDSDGSRAAIQKAIVDLLNHPPAGSHNQARMAGEIITLPDQITTPPVEMTAGEINETLRFIRAIAGDVRQRFARSRIMIVYIPSPAMSYDITSDTLDTYYTKTPVAAASIRPLSNTLCNSLHGIAQQHGMAFLDARPGFLAHGQQELLHGKADIGHPNEAGYRVLATLIGDFLSTWQTASDTLPATACAVM